jgi:hypothetical protein
MYLFLNGIQALSPDDLVNSPGYEMFERQAIKNPLADLAG